MTITGHNCCENKKEPPNISTNFEAMLFLLLLMVAIVYSFVIKQTPIYFYCAYRMSSKNHFFSSHRACTPLPTILCVKILYNLRLNGLKPLIFLLL